MSLIGKFFISSLISFFLLMVISFVWPKFTGQPRPYILESVYALTKDTNIGRQTASVLGVSDERSVTPIHPEEIVSSMKEWVVKTVSDKAQNIFQEAAIEQIRSGYGKMSDAEKILLYEAICASSSSDTQD